MSVQTKPCRCVQVSPFRVEIDGTQMDAFKEASVTWAVNDTGRAIVDFPALPVCIKTSR